MTAVSSMGDLSLLGGTQLGSSPTPQSQGSTPRSRSKSLVAVEENAMLPDLKSSENAVDRTRPLPTSLQSDFIPEDVLFALTQPPTGPKDRLGPPSSHKIRNLDVSTAFPRKAAANVWNFPKRRDKFQHLTKNTPCICGAGKDISFLYDVPKKEDKPVRPDPRDPSQLRLDEDPPKKKSLSLPDTLIPEEYHVVKNRGVMGLEYHEDNFATKPEDHENHLVKFPSMNPTSRYEVVQLKKTMLEMLEKAGVLDDYEDQKGPTQMHNLMELIKKEQDIYNIVFHELIRQASVECVERGELLADLRGRYSNLLNKVPRQIKGLHEEVLAQRALDRRLTEELMRFKSTIGVLTSELSEVKEHDKEVTNQAQQAQEDLKNALSESAKNASLLAEYHDLYELQRLRLEKQVSMLADEKEIWSAAAYSLSLKVMEEHSLNTAKRLHVAEKAWAKLANHFTILLSDKDTEMLTKLQGHVDNWRDLVDDFNRELNVRENSMREQIQVVRAGIYHWIKDFERHLLSKDGHLLRQPDKERVSGLFSHIKQWEEILGQENEKFGGDVLLTGQECLSAVRHEMNGWTVCAMKVFNRHQGEEETTPPDMEDMLKMNTEVENLLQQYSVRINGENGVASGIMHIGNSLETWDNKFSALLHGSNPLPDQEWLRFFQLMDDWLNTIDETIDMIGSSQKEDDRTEGRPHVQMVVQDMMKMTQKWLSSTTNGIDSEDAKLVEQVTTLHTEMVRWMVQMLLRLAPDRSDHSAEAKEAILLGSTTIGQLQSNAKTLFERLAMFTKYVTSCCSGFVGEEMQRRLDAREDNPDHEQNELQKVRVECEEWVVTARMMLCELTGEPYVPESPQQSLTTLAQGDRPPKKTVYHDQEKLQSDVTGVSETKTEDDEKPPSDSPAPEEGPASVEEPSTTGQEAGPGEEPADVTGQQEEASETKEEEPAKEVEPQVTEAPPTHPGTPIPVSSNHSGNSLQNELVEEGEEEEEPEDDRLKLEVIGTDNNTRVRALDEPEVPEKAETPPALPRERPVTPTAPNTKKAYEALAAVESLQSQLIATEERAQTAEERAANAEAELNLLQDKIRNLERKLASSPTSQQGDTPKSATSKPVEKPETTEKPEGKEPEKEKTAKSGKSSRSSSRTSVKSKKSKAE